MFREFSRALAILLTPAFAAVALAVTALAVGDPAPAVTLSLDDGKTLDVAKAEKPLVVYFFPKDDTPGCTKEACTYRDRADELTKAGAIVVGISFDDADAHKKFREKYKLPFLLATDDGKVAEAFDVKVRGMGGLKFHSRDTIVIGADHKVKAILRGVDPVKSVDDVLAALKG